MPLLTLPFDHAGRPVVELCLSETQAVREALAEAGADPVPPASLLALVDTGARETCVDRSILDKLGLTPIGEVRVHTASTGPDPKLLDQYAVQLFFAGIAGGRLAANLRVIAAEDLSGFGIQMLLGCDVLARCLLFFNGPEKQFTLGFDADSRME